MKDSWYSFLPKKTHMHEWRVMDFAGFAFEWFVFLCFSDMNGLSIIPNFPFSSGPMVGWVSMPMNGRKETSSRE